MWIEARYRPNGGGVWSPDTFREFAAGHLDNADSRLFWSKEGKPNPGAPRITFIGSEKWCGIRVVGSPGKAGLDEFRNDSDIALRHANQIAVALDKEFGGLHAVDIVSGEHDVAEKRYTKYHIRKLMLPRSKCRSMRDELLKALPERGSKNRAEVQPAYLDLLEATILNGLKEEFPDKAGLFFNGFDWKEPPRWGVPLSVNGDLVFNAVDLVFSLPVRITGPVQVGSLRARGFGDIRILTWG
jgi:hypothetical protein